MRISELNIFRVREIEQRRLNFEDKQLVAILGENGSGKTTLLASIIYLLSGEVILKGGKDRMIRDVGTGDSWVFGIITHGDTRFSIKRFLSSSACELVYLDASNQKPIKGATKVQIELDRMGLTPKRVLRTLMEQGKYGTLFHDTDGDRLRSMFEIFGLRDCDEIQRAVITEAALIPVDHTIAERWQAAKTQNDEDAAKLSTATIERCSFDVSYRVYATARQTVAAAADVEAKLSLISRLNGSLTAVVEISDKAAAARSTNSDGLATTRSAIEGMATELVAAQGVISASATFETMVKTLPAHQTAATGLGATLRDKTAACSFLKVMPPQDEALVRLEFNELTAGVSRSRAALAVYANFDAAAASTVTKQAAADADALALSVFSPGLTDEATRIAEDHRLLVEQVKLGESGVCPTCKQAIPTAHECLPLTDSLPMLALCKTALTAITAQVKARDKAAGSASVSAGVLAAAQQHLEIARSNLPSDKREDLELAVTSGLARLGVLAPMLDESSKNAAAAATLVHEIAQLRAKIDSHVAAAAQIEALRVDPDKANAAKDVAGRAAELATKLAGFVAVDASLAMQQVESESEIRKLQAQRDAVPVPSDIDPQVVEDAKATVAAAATIEDDRNAVEGAFAAADTRAKISAQGFANIDVMRRQNESNVRKHELINDLKFLVGVKNFPMYVAGYYVQAINALWAEELELVDAGFTAWQDETSLEFFVSFHGGDSTRMLYQASGGERQLASIGYQIVLNKLFAAGVDFIAFDEPTTHVDANYRPKLVQAFTRMAGRPDFKDAQIVVVDHSVEFTTAISDPIVLTKLG